MKNNFFGNLELKGDCWIGKESVFLFEKNREFEVQIKSIGDHLSEIQENCISLYKENQVANEQKALEALLAYYLINYESIAERIDLPENYRKEYVSSSDLRHLMKITTVFFDEKGNYGWIGICSFEKNGIAFLLSESDVRVINPTQLRNLHKINDLELGLLIHNGKNYWKGLEQHHFLGELENLEIEFEGEETEDISDVQKKAYATYREKKETHFHDLSRMLLGVYMGDDQKADGIMGEINVVMKGLVPKILCIDKEGNYGWICYTEWNNQYLGVLLSEDQIQVMRVDELRSFSKKEKVRDGVLGLLFPSYMGYDKTIIVRMAGKIRILPLTIRADEKCLNDKMRDAYRKYLEINGTLWEEIKDVTLEYFLSSYNWFSSFLKLPETLKKENVTRDSVMTLITFTELFIDDEGRIAWLCESPTTEDGLAFEFTTGEIELITQPEII